MFHPDDIKGFKGYIDDLPIKQSSKANYKTYVNWLNQYSEVNLSSLRAFSEKRIIELAETVKHPRIKFGPRRKSDSRTILRHFRDYKANAIINTPRDEEEETEDEARNRLLVSISERKGQPKFRRELLERYNHQCVITGCDCVLALEAAHILPFSSKGRMNISNGLLLRSDIHTLFDLHEISINPKSMKVHCSKSIRNSKPYSELHNRRIHGEIRYESIPALTDHFEGRKKT